MKAKCSKHGEVELTAPNANGDCFFYSCAFEMLTQEDAAWWRRLDGLVRLHHPVRS